MMQELTNFTPFYIAMTVLACACCSKIYQVKDNFHTCSVVPK